MSPKFCLEFLKNHYVCRSWAGLHQDGGQGTPLQVELRSDSGSEADDEVEDLSSGGEDDEKGPGEEAVNFSVQDEIIELLDSNDEEEYNNSQLFIDESPHDERGSPSLLPRDHDWISLSEEDETSDVELGTGTDQVEDNYDTIEDEEEIQILNESQNSLYYKIAKVIKTEPIDGDDPNLMGDQLGPSSSKGEFFQESEREFFQDLQTSIEGADEKMVIEAYRKIKINADPDTDDVIQLVVREVEDSAKEELNINEKSKQLAKTLKTSPSDAKEKLIEEKKASQDLEEENTESDVAIEDLLDGEEDEAKKP